MIAKLDGPGINFNSNTSLCDIEQVLQDTQHRLVRYKCDYTHTTLSSSLAQSWQTLFLIYFRFMCCLACPKFMMEMKCETTLRDLEITQILFLRDHKEGSRQKVYLLFTSVYFSACVVDFCYISCYNKCYFSKWTFFSEVWKIIFFSFLAWIFQIWNDLGKHLSHNYCL